MARCRGCGWPNGLSRQIHRFTAQIAAVTPEHRIHAHREPPSWSINASVKSRNPKTVQRQVLHAIFASTNRLAQAMFRSRSACQMDLKPSHNRLHLGNQRFSDKSEARRQALIRARVRCDAGSGSSPKPAKGLAVKGGGIAARLTQWTWSGRNYEGATYPRLDRNHAWSAAVNHAETVKP